MDKIKNIDEYISEQMGSEVAKKGKNPILWLLLTVVGVAVIVVSFSDSLSDSVQTLLLTIGSIMAAVGAVVSVLCITKTMWVYTYLPTGSRIATKTVYLALDDYKRFKEMVSNSSYGDLGELHPQVSTNMGVELARSADGRLVLLQAGRYDVGHFEPETEVVRLEGDGASSVQAWFK